MVMEMEAEELLVSGLILNADQYQRHCEADAIDWI